MTTKKRRVLLTVRLYIMKPEIEGKERDVAAPRESISGARAGWAYAV